MTVLAEHDWGARERAHLRRVKRWTGPHRARQARGEKHPVLDFLFTYYSHRPARLERWHPGPGVLLAGPAADRFARRPGYTTYDCGVGLDPTAFTEARARTARFVLDLLTATAGRAPRLGCFGLHEWAMVYRTERVRHEELPLRLGEHRTNELLERLPVRCSHADAFRFFTPAARGLNEQQPTRDSQLALEQPGCLHANMDLYKWAYKLDPFVPGELLADCFELAVHVRELDMRASPYDLTAFGYTPVRIESPAGRAAYVEQQAAFAERAAPLREALIEHARSLLSWSGFSG